MRLVRAEQRAGALWYELTHDRLIEPIRASNPRFFERRTRRRLRRAVVALVALGATSAGLILAFLPAGAQVAATLTPTRLNFGATTDPSPSPPQRLTFASGSKARSIRVATSGDADSFRLTNGCHGTVPAGTTCTIEARFAPAARGAIQARVHVDVDGQPAAVASLSGRLNGGICGVERWAVKTLQDPAATSINREPQRTTIADLARLPAPASRTNSRNRPVELTTYRVRARLIAMSIQEDSDLKLVIADSGPVSR